MTTATEQSSESGVLDILKLLAAAGVLVGGLYGYYYYIELSLPLRVLMVLGGLALGIAAVEYSVFAGIAEPADGGIRMFGLSFGTAAYLAGYATAGAILIALGIWKIRSARPNG